MREPPLYTIDRLAQQNGNDFRNTSHVRPDRHTQSFQVAAARFFALPEGLEEICHIPARLANSSNRVERTGMMYLLTDRPIISRDLKNGHKVSLSRGSLLYQWCV